MPEAPLLEVLDVTVRFGGVTAVNGARFEVEPSTVTGLIGPNGAGKTTLFNVITGIQPPTAGRVRYDGRDVTRYGTHRRARLGIARTFQRLEAFGSLSVWENVLCAAEIHKLWRPGARTPHQVARELMDEVGITDFADAPADAVPTGIARLLELARALAIEPRLLLLDEPSSGLGDEETDTFGELLRRLAARGTTVLMVEHDMDLVMTVCDHIHVLDFGTIIASGTPTEIQQDRNVQEAYLGVQV
jgi:branched-chain amino acid transport system ATP-binding protein